MAYKLAPHVTEEMLVEMGFGILHPLKRHSECKCALRVNTFIPLEDSRYGNRVIQDVMLGTLPEDFNPAKIQDLIEKGMVIEC